MDFPNQILYRIHAVRRMFQREIFEKDVQTVLKKGHIIQDYQDDKPYPSFLILGWVRDRPIHVVAARNDENNQTIIITVYEPDIDEWKPGFAERRDL